MSEQPLEQRRIIPRPPGEQPTAGRMPPAGDAPPAPAAGDTPAAGTAPSAGDTPAAAPQTVTTPDTVTERQALAEGTPTRTVQLEGLRAFYGRAEQVKGVDLEFKANEVTAIIGPSGCGKSTMIRCINRMHEEIPGARAEGRVLLDGLDVYEHSVDVVAVRRAIGMVFQKPNPFPTMSIFDNVAAGMRLTGMRRRGAELSARVERALVDAGLWDEVSERLSEPGVGLSGGQQQRLCIARSLAVDPEVILMDEPCSALDPVATLKIEELIDDLKQRVTIVIVTHNMQQAARVADRTAFMLDGRLVEAGPTQEIFTNPSDPRTEEYVTGKFG
ncbi:MAG TPA: phosphate ABC transporter ATP-binding protein PstB [Solirubrobacteraceae bacterium]|nr:phosphate ABC transporter ATP-binding protein PstB [Solirubrobacteraceae bacterium]